MSGRRGEMAAGMRGSIRQVFGFAVGHGRGRPCSFGWGGEGGSRRGTNDADEGWRVVGGSFGRDRPSGKAGEDRDPDSVGATWLSRRGRKRKGAEARLTFSGPA
jgi:hypothetical protein